VQYCCYNGQANRCSTAAIMDSSSTARTVRGTCCAVRSIIMYVSNSYEGKHKMEGMYGSVTWLSIFLQKVSLPTAFLVLPVKYLSVNAMTDQVQRHCFLFSE
jgi:hypothetical protein